MFVARSRSDAAGKSSFPAAPSVSNATLDGDLKASFERSDAVHRAC